MAEFVMPKLGADMTTGTLIAWRKKPGEAVRRGDIVAEVETEKGTIEVEVFVEGVVDRLLVEPGAKVPVGAAMALIRDGATSAMPAVPGPPAAARLPISPSARRLARELGVDPATVHGTGHGGAITREDIERAAAAAKPAPVKPADDRTRRMRQTIAAAMSRSKREIPHYYLSTSIDLHPAISWLAQENAKRAVTSRLLPGALFIKSVALALREVPELNSLWVGDRPRPSEDIHVGVAISLRQGGLVAPALHHADRLSLDELMAKMLDLVNRARAGTLRSSELSDPTITVTSLGDQGVETVFGIVYPPQSAIVGFGRIADRPWVVNGQVVPRPMVTATLSADHRVSDGHRGGLFLAAVNRLLQEPAKL